MTHNNEKKNGRPAASADELESPLFPSFKGQIVAEQHFKTNPYARTAENYSLTSATNFSARLYQAHYEDPWSKEAQKDKGRPLADSFKGRVGIRAFSRGILGTALMTWAELEANDFDPGLIADVKQGIKENTIDKHELSKFSLTHRFFDSAARFFDNTAGQAIKYGIAKPYSMISGKSFEDAAHGMLHFRSKRNYSAHDLEKARNILLKDPIPEHNFVRIYGKLSGTPEEHQAFQERFSAWEKRQTPQTLKDISLRKLNGRSLGHEMVDTTFSFAMGSIGDATGRHLVSVLDPNVRKDWIDEKGIHPLGMLKSLRDAAWDILSYRQMEDWVVALPYVYTMKAMRPLQAKLSPNSKIGIDSNYGPMSVISKDASHYLGDTAVTAAINLQLRFSLYNFYTLMFRDSYHHAAHSYVTWKQNNFSIAPEHNVETDHKDKPHHSLGEKAVGAFNYAAMSFIKSQTWMTPAVLFFWPQRLSLIKSNGRIVFADADNQNNSGIVTNRPRRDPPLDVIGQHHLYASPDMTVTASPATMYLNNGVLKFRDDKSKDALSQNWYPEPRRSTPQAAQGNPRSAYINEQEITNASRVMSDKGESVATANYDPYKARKGDSILGAMMNPVGRMMYSMQTTLEKGIKSIVNPENLVPGTTGYRYFKNTEFLSNRLVSNALSYTPYMIAKAELENKVNTVAADASLYRAIEGAEHLDMKEARAGLYDYINCIIQQPISDVTRARVYDGKGLINSMQRSKDIAHQQQHKDNAPTHAEIIHHEAKLGLKKPAVAATPTTPKTEDKTAKVLANEAIERVRTTSSKIVSTTDKSFPLDGDQGKVHRDRLQAEAELKRTQEEQPISHLARLQIQQDTLQGAPSGVTLH